MRHLTAGLIGASLLALAVVGSQGLGHADEPLKATAKARVAWEYCSIHEEDVKGLAILGDEGWEAYAASVHPKHAGTRIYLKRVKE